MLDTLQSGAVATDFRFYPLDGVNTKTATAPEEILSNMKSNVEKYKTITRLHQLPEFQKIKGSNKSIAVVGGGPSVNNYIDDIKQFRTVVAAGSSHDYLVENGVKLTYAIICDPDPLSINYYQKLDTETKYLVASGCDEKIFEHIKNHPLVMWHCHSDSYSPSEIEVGYQAVGGGCTVGLRSLSIALLLGYNHIHIFGMDSCMADNGKSHAYITEDIGDTYSIKVAQSKSYLPDGIKTFKCAGYQLAQAWHFIEFYKHHNQYFTPYIYGDGLLAEVMKNINANIAASLNGVKQ